MNEWEKGMNGEFVGGREKPTSFPIYFPIERGFLRHGVPPCIIHFGRIFHANHPAIAVMWVKQQ